jgi:hypothetical protein
MLVRRTKTASGWFSTNGWTLKHVASIFDAALPFRAYNKSAAEEADCRNVLLVIITLSRLN